MSAWKSRPPGWSRIRWTSRTGLGLLAAFMLPILILAVVSIVSIGQRAATRQLLVEERYVRIADLVSTNLDETMAEWEREMLAELDEGPWTEKNIIQRLHGAERTFPALRPMLMLAPDGRIVYPLRASETNAVPSFSAELARILLPTDDSSVWLFDRGQEAELWTRNLTLAERMYRRAVGAAVTSTDRVRALNALARTQRKVGRPKDAVETYERIVEIADPFDAELSRWAIVARQQSSDALGESGDEAAACDSTFKAIEFLIEHRFNLDADVYEFYRGELEAALRRHDLDDEQMQRLDGILASDRELESLDSSLTVLVRQASQLEAIAASTRLVLGSIPASEIISDPRDGRDATEWSTSYLNLQADVSGATVFAERGDTGWRLIRRWRPASVQKLLTYLLEQDGPWRGYGVALLDSANEIVSATTDSPPEEKVTARIDLVALPGWHIAAFPRAGTLATVGQRDVVDYAILLMAAFLAVVGGLLLASRTLAREVALAGARSDFVSNVSHELKTPLSLIRMFAENLRAGWVPESKKPEYYQVMLSESERLSGVIENVLDFSRIESGHRDFRLNPDDLTRLIADIIERYRYSFETAGIRLDADLPDEPVVVPVDREGIEQVLVNLLSNATKYIGDGDKRVAVKLAPQEDSVRIEVSDTGVGMSAEAVEQIFDPFYRIDDTASRPVAGSGIGLTIVRHIVDAHRGRIDVESAPGQGTTFAVTLPRATTAQPGRRTTGMEIDAEANGNDPLE